MYQFFVKTFLICGVIFPLIGHADGFVRGINYDPVHSLSFAQGIGTDNQQLMQQGIFDDLDALKALENKAGFKITHLKTFFTQYNSLHNLTTINMADVVYQWNQRNPDSALTLALGVYEFRPRIDACITESECQQWTQAQIDAVKQALSAYKTNPIPLIDRIIVGNEDLETNFMDERLVKDINQIKAYIQQNGIQNVSVGTAQTQPAVMAIYQGTNYQNVLEAADFIGINVYPFWSNIPYGAEGLTAKQAFANVWSDLKKSKNWGTKPLIETEEGWPSAGRYPASLYNQHDYFYYWLYGHNYPNQAPKPGEDSLVQTSYFFALNDKLPGQGIESNWGLFSADNSTNIFDNLQLGEKKLAPNLVFPLFNNFIGADLNKQVVYNVQDLHQVIITACSDNNGKGACYPLYGFQGSGAVSSLTVDRTSWNATKHSYTRFYPGQNNQLMIDTSNQYYKSLLIVLDDNNRYPGICWVNADSLQNLKNGSQINIIWPDGGEPQPCQINLAIKLVDY